LKGTALKGVGDSPQEGFALCWDGPISFLGDVDPSTGILRKDGKEMDLKDKILFFREGAGSTVGSYVVYNLRLNDKAPRSMVMIRADAIISIGCILADIPLVHRVDPVDWEKVETGDRVVVDPKSGSVSVWKVR
jgi:predicted aconitase with swiveling domain